MTFSIPDVELAEMSLEELREHSRICAGVDNAMQTYILNLQFEIIKRVNAGHQASYVSAPKRQATKKYTRAQILAGEDDEFSLSMDDFR